MVAKTQLDLTLKCMFKASFIKFTDSIHLAENLFLSLHSSF